MSDLRTALSNLVKNCVLPTAGNEQFQQAVDDARAALAQPEPYPLPDSLYPDSKDWAASDYWGRVELLHFMYESKTREVEQLEAAQFFISEALSQSKPIPMENIGQYTVPCEVRNEGENK